MRRPRLPSSRGKVVRLAGLLMGRARAVVLTHDNPDPDAMAAGLCLAHLVERLSPAQAVVTYGGIVGRAENRAMVQALNMRLVPVSSVQFGPDDAVILVDTQPAFGNNSLPDGQHVTAVIDHHPGRRPRHVPLADIRPHYGAVTTILTEYLVSARVELPIHLATAICYGIATETQDLGREATRADVAAFLEAFPVCNQRLLGRLHHPRRSIGFLRELDRAVRVAQVLDDIIVCHMGRVSLPDTVSEMADMLIATEGAEWALCTGACGGRLYLSARTWQGDANAGALLRRVVGERGSAGGHGMVAGGQMDLAARQALRAVLPQVTARFLEALGKEPSAELTPLLARRPPEPTGEGKGAEGGQQT